MKFTIIAAGAALFLSIFSSCTEEYPIDLSGIEPILVVQGAISSDTMAHTVVLSKSADYFSNKPFEGVSNASVTISDGTNIFVLQEDTNKKGYYRTAKDVHGVAGRTYSLAISNVDVNGDGKNETYTASCELKAIPAIDSIEVEKIKRFGNYHWYIKMTAKDPGETQDFYMMKVCKNDILVTDSIEEWGFTDDEFFNGKQLQSLDVMALSDKKADEIVKENDKITLEMYSITKDYEKYINEVLEELQGRNPLFGSAPANPRTNISNGASGYFAAYSVTRSSTRYHEKKQ
jgi:hypothetical protein